MRFCDPEMVFCCTLAVLCELACKVHFFALCKLNKMFYGHHHPPGGIKKESFLFHANQISNPWLYAEGRGVCSHFLEEDSSSQIKRQQQLVPECGLERCLRDRHSRSGERFVSFSEDESTECTKHILCHKIKYRSAII